MKKSPTARIDFRVPATMKRRLLTLARKRNKSLSDLIRETMRQELRKEKDESKS